jgi:hypothetical protein
MIKDTVLVVWSFPKPQPRLRLSYYTLLQKEFVVWIGNIYFVLVLATDIICMIQKINGL